MPNLKDLLPTALSERCLALNERALEARGEYVLYWMHHAMRAHDNPALDTALALGARLDKPVLVYQGLAGTHPYNSDRHHLFILQGARDVARELAERGITYQFFLPDGDTATSPLPTLCQHAAAVIVEQMPVAPFPRWQQRLAAAATTALFSVDARCIVPLPLPDRRYTRAFEFRNALQDEYDARTPLGWSFDADAPRGVAVQEVFAPLDVATLDDEALLRSIARLPIDHSVAPVHDTPGGAKAGYRRWQAFVEGGLRHYHRQRNDAAILPPAGVSRMSAYLHYGQVSVFRIAQQAFDIGGAGAEKYLDELLIWRELAQHFCFHSKDPDALSALPDWAQETLQQHADDPRPERFSLRTLQRAATGHELWDLMQRSLLCHGELHNNLRMTWAKAIPQWTPSPEQALAALLDLNHRYALDGNDPSSYGGLLWALGQFDRPFTPEQPVLGRVRGRSLRAHAKRLDVATYRQHIERPQGARLRVAIIGAGIAGLSAAQALRDQQHEVVVIEKSRGPGGRMATRRAGHTRFNHGAQYFTARDWRFARHTDAWLEDGVIERWPDAVVTLHDEAPADARLRFRGRDGMNALCKAHAAGIELVTECRIEAITADGSRWQLQADAATAALDDSFDVVLTSAPAPQSAALLRDCHEAFAEAAAAVTYTPCWALMFTTSGNGSAWDAARGDGDIAWLGRTRAPAGKSAWTAHASTSWSSDNLEATRDDVIAALLPAAERLLGHAADAESVMAHRWRYARVQNPMRIDCLFDSERGIGACGDWCATDARVEDAWLSGQALAGRVLAMATLGKRTATANG